MKKKTNKQTKTIDQKTTAMLAKVLSNNSRLDYCNSLYYTLTRRYMGRLQHVQNTVCCVICKSSPFSSITPLLKSLHWLPVEFRILFKINMLSYKAITTGFPKYLNCYLKPYYLQDELVCQILIRRYSVLLISNLMFTNLKFN